MEGQPQYWVRVVCLIFLVTGVQRVLVLGRFGEGALAFLQPGGGDNVDAGRPACRLVLGSLGVFREEVRISTGIKIPREASTEPFNQSM
eukprot:scaffold182988_cov52-Attheya_sp.AAC.1